MCGPLLWQRARQNDIWKGTKDAQDFIWIGGLQFGNRQQYLEGQLDEVKFFTRVLSEDEIKVEMRPDKRLAFSPQPVPGSVLQQEIPVTLAWTPGGGATAHNVYVGTSKDDLQLVSAAQSATSFVSALCEARQKICNDQPLVVTKTCPSFRTSPTSQPEAH